MSPSRRQSPIFLTGCVCCILLLTLQHALWTTYISITLDHSTTVVNHALSLRGNFVSNKGFDEKSRALLNVPYPPLSCRSMLKDVQQKSDGSALANDGSEESSNSVHNVVIDVNEGVGHFRLTTTQRDSMKGIPPFWVSLHKPEVDKVRWCIMTYGQYYETKLTQAIYKTLLEYSPSDAMFLDVGGNIGWFSLVARSLGYEVAVFEPNPVNQLRLCQSLQLNDWLATEPAINLYPYGVGDQHDSKLVLKQMDLKNPGAGTLRQDAVPKNKGTSHNADQVVSVVSLDEMAIQNKWISRENGKALPGSKVIAFMKVDVEGFESFVFKGAQKLLFQSKLVKNVEIEWNGEKYLNRSTKMFEISDKNKQVYEKDPVVQLTQLGKGPYELYRIGDYLGPDLSGESKRKKFGSIPPTDEYLVKELSERFRDKSANLWFRLRE